MLASEVMNRSAALLNDRVRSNFTYEAQIPYLNMAIDELQETMEQYNIPITNKVSIVLPLLAGATSISTIPADLIEIQHLYERDTGQTDSDYYPITKVEFLPQGAVAGSKLIWWSWQGQVIHFIGAIGNKDIKLEYIARLQTPVLDELTVISQINAKSFLAYRNASLCAEFIGENKTRADTLNMYALMALDRMLGINVKASQGMPVRRQPFMAGYKSRR